MKTKNERKNYDCVFHEDNAKIVVLGKKLSSYRGYYSVRKGRKFYSIEIWWSYNNLEENNSIISEICKIYSTRDIVVRTEAINFVTKKVQLFIDLFETDDEKKERLNYEREERKKIIKQRNQEEREILNKQKEEDEVRRLIIKFGRELEQKGINGFGKSGKICDKTKVAKVSQKK